MVLSEIKEAWGNLSEDEKAAVTKELVKDLDEAKEMKTLSVQNTTIAAFHDARANLDVIFEEVGIVLTLRP